MKKVILTVILVVLFVGISGCATYSHTQSVRNEIGQNVTQAYIRDTGTTDWGSVKIVSNAMQIILFTDPSTSATPKGMRNQDIMVRDNNGIVYIKYNVPITYTTTKYTYLIFFYTPTKTVATSNPITFTERDRVPRLNIINQTGYPITVTSPVSQQTPVKNEARTFWQNLNQIQSVRVTYTVGQMQYSEQVTMNNEDTTVTLTRRPPEVTIINNTGDTINLVQMRVASDAAWLNQNILGLQLNDDGTVNSSNASTNANERSGSIVNLDNFRFWLGMVALRPDKYDIRVDDVRGNSYVKTNVQITSDVSLSFSASDKR